MGMSLAGRQKMQLAPRGCPGRDKVSIPCRCKAVLPDFLGVRDSKLLE